MLEQSLRKLFEQQAEAEPPPARITVTGVLRQGRLRRRRHRIGAMGAPAVAAVAVAAIALTGALPSGDLGRTNPQARGYGRLVGGAFDPSYLAINFGWHPKGTMVTGGQTSPGEEDITAYSNSAEWTLFAYAPGVCQANTAERRFQCLPAALPLQTASITGRGPVVDGNRSLWLSIGGQAPGLRPTLAWEYAPDAWALLQDMFGPGGATAERIARGAEFGQHIPFRFASRFTSLPRGWRIIGTEFDSQNGQLPAGVFLATAYKILRLRTISPATPGNPGNDTYPNVPFIMVHPAIPGGQGCTFIGPSKDDKTSPVTIDGYRLTLGDLHTREQGRVESNLQLCGGPLDGSSVAIDEIGIGAHPNLALSPTQLMQRMQLLGTNPADWVTNPLP